MSHNFQHAFNNGDDAGAVQHSFQEQDPYYYDQNQDDVNAQGSEWYEVSCVEAGLRTGRGDAVRKVAFDPLKELIWVATASGMVHSHNASDMSRVISSYICEPDRSMTDDVRDIVVSKNSVLAAVGYGLAIIGRGGVFKATVRADAIKDAKALALNPLSDKHVCIGGESRMLAVVDLERQRILRQATLRGATGVTNALWAAPENVSSITIFSTSTGRLSFCDPSSMREVNAIAAFAGSTTSVASSGFYLAATGLGSRGGLSYLEQGVKLYDIRALESPLPSVMYSAPPMFVKFDAANGNYYDSEGAMWVLSPNGILQLLDISTVASGSPAYPLCNEIRLDAGSDVFTSIAVSSQGLLALGDSGGFIHQWTSSDAIKVNENSDPIWTSAVTTEAPTPSIRLDGMLSADLGISIPKCAIPDFDNSYLTDDLFGTSPENRTEGSSSRLNAVRRITESNGGEDLYKRKAFAQFPLRISEDILSKAKRQSFVGYAQAPPSFIRNSHSGHESPPVLKGVATGKNVRGVKNNVDSPRKVSKSLEMTSSPVKFDVSRPATRCSYVEMDLVAWESLEGFNFSKYNKSGLFCGLENALPNVYVNAAVQVLYFSPPIRKAIGGHSCDQDWCISCELGFLFHMFDLGGAGMACEAGNFTRAFMTMANAGALELLDGPHALPLSQRIESFTRYLLEQLHKDDELKEKSTVSSVFGAETVSYGTFLPSKKKWERISGPFQHTLIYDSNVTGTTFCELVQHSLSHSLEPTRAFCEASGQFEMMSQHREIRSLPNVLLLGCNTKVQGYSEWWLGEEAAASHQNASWDVSQDTGDILSDPEQLDEIVSAAMQKGSKLVGSMRIELSNGVNVTEIDNADVSTSGYGYDRVNSINGTKSSSDSAADYDLSFVISHVPPSAAVCNSVENGGTARNLGGHLVAYIRVPEEYRHREGKETEGKAGFIEEDSGWWCFNDFVISPCEGLKEVGAFDRYWKKPCLLGYIRRDIKERIIDTKNVKEVSVSEILGDENRNGAIGLGIDEEGLGKGCVLALDCEFVMVGREEADIFGDGSREVVIPARRALARVSVIHGSGKRKGSTLIDDYVAVREPVVDYLTRFSGLVEGDLDAERSRHKVSSLKSVYKRLRALVDAGCIFVGHGLKSDFRIINFVVPPEQVIDTVTLFRVGKKRLLGLRFLCNTFLGRDIQTETHDSIEDSDAALELYEMCCRLKSGEGGEERFQQTLKDLYAYGYSHAWKSDPADPFVIQDDVWRSL